MSSEFWKLLQDVTAEQGALPLIHTTDVAYFNFIRARGKIEPQKRPDYNDEHLIFLFYGRPSFRVNANRATVDTKAFAPICLITNHTLVENSWRIMPFDSGALKHGDLTPPIHPSMTDTSFELLADPQSPMKLIKLFFGSERSYFDGRPLPNVDFDRLENLPADAYDRLIRNQSNTRLDDRVSAIEIQINQPIKLFNNIRAIILPHEFLDKQHVIDQIQSWRDVSIIPYNLPQSYRPGEIMGTIREKVRDHYVQAGYFS